MKLVWSAFEYMQQTIFGGRKISAGKGLKTHKDTETVFGVKEKLTVLMMTKPVFWFSDKASFKPVSTATGTS